jgi:hypothetical protein
VKTSELIAALAADPVPEPIRLGRRVAAVARYRLCRQRCALPSVAWPPAGHRRGRRVDGLLDEVRRRHVEPLSP